MIRIASTYVFSPCLEVVLLTVKDDANKLFAELGLALSGAFNIFVRQALRHVRSTKIK
jgi:hypothetical protein